jgi:hypothetical protein
MPILIVKFLACVLKSKLSLLSTVSITRVKSAHRIVVRSCAACTIPLYLYLAC